MSWKEERDALIAQTLAFVQSVTGKPADFAQLAPATPAVAPQPIGSPAVVPSTSAQEQHTEAALADAAGFEMMRAEAAMIDAAMQLVARNLPRLAPAAPPATATGTGLSVDSQAPVSEPSPPDQHAEFTGEHFTSITSELGLQRDMQTEIRSRVANFRANQERFNRERQEYFSSTLAKLRASMNDVPPSDK